MTAPEDASAPLTPAAAPPAILAARRRGELLVSPEAVAAAIDRVSVRLSLALQDTNPLLLTVMNGGVPFSGALLTRLNFPLETGYVHVGRYGDETRGGALRWHATPVVPLSGRTVLLVDDILDRGTTMAALVGWAEQAGASRVLSAVLVDKARDAPRPVEADYVALRCPDRYLFGWGLDFRGYWRNLPGIYALPRDMEDAG